MQDTAAARCRRHRTCIASSNIETSQCGNKLDGRNWKQKKRQSKEDMTKHTQEDLQGISITGTEDEEVLAVIAPNGDNSSSNDPGGSGGTRSKSK